VLTQQVLEIGGPDTDCDGAIEAWERRSRRAFERFVAILDKIKASRSYNTTTLPVAVREVRNLLRGVVGAGTETPR
jgi:NAD-specific glutamate dehydrogenase